MIERYVSPAELKRLLSSLLVVAIFISLFAIFAFVVVPGLRNANKPASAESLSPPSGEWGWLDPTAFPAEKGHVVPPIDPATVMNPNPALLSRGQAVFLQNCASCHGPKGEGDGPAGMGLAVKPRNFTKGEGWKNGAQITGIYQTLEQGIKGSPMVSYNYLSRRDRMALVHVVQGLGAFPRGPEDPKALAALAKSFAASGEVIPNRIPVRKAMELLAAEGKAPDPALSKAFWFVSEGPPSLPGFGRPIRDDVKAAHFLAGVSPSQDQAAFARLMSVSVPGNGFAPWVLTKEPEYLRSLQDSFTERRAR